VADLPGDELFENRNAMPRFFLVHEARPAKSLADAREMIRRGEIDFRRTAILDSPVTLSPAPAPGEVEEAKAVDYQPDSVEIQVRSRGSSLLVMSESYYPGWDAWVDGKPATVHPANIALRGIVVPDGDHRVRMEFRPKILTASLGVSLATMLGLFAMAFYKPRQLQATDRIG
jgi:hypothetical protein